VRQKSRPSGSSFFSSTFHFFALAFSCTAWNKNVKHERKKIHTHPKHKKRAEILRKARGQMWLEENIATKTQKGTELHNVCSKYNKQKKKQKYLVLVQGAPTKRTTKKDRDLEGKTPTHKNCKTCK